MVEKILEQAVGQGGAFAIAMVLLYFYRRDHQRKHDAKDAAHERRDKREDQLLAIVERQATASEALVQTIRQLDATLMEHHRFATSQTASLTAQLDSLPGKVRHEVAPMIDKVLWQGRKPESAS